MDDTIFRKCRSKQGEVWQLDRYESPLWTAPDEGGQPFRSQRAVCRSVRTGRHVMSLEAPGEPGPEMFQEVVARAARAWRLRPEHIEVADSRLAEELAGLLSAEGVPVEVRSDLPELRALFSEWAFSARGAVPPALLEPDLTVERIAAFAQAAARFAEAAPWRHLDRNEDVLVLEAPGLPEELRCARVLGPPEEGALFHPEEEGELDLVGGEIWDGRDWEEEDWDAWDDEDSFFEEEDSFSEEGNWKVSLLPPSRVPPEDVELWMRYELPLACSHAYPVAFRGWIGVESERPDARLLSWFEAVLAALASTTEEEMDAGRWEKEVATSAGTVRLELSIPSVLVPAYADDMPWEDDEEVPAAVGLADELATEALGAWGRRQIHLARRAVALWPDCIDAWLVLARRAVDLETARDLYAEAVAAGERLFDRDEQRGAFLPYLWARGGLAQVLWRLGAREEAVSHFQGMLAVDAGDRARTRYPLASALLVLERDEDVEDLLTRFKEDRPDWWYARALLTFRREGDSPVARQHLAAALRSDRRVAKELLSPTRTFPEEFGRENTPKWEGDIVLFLDAWTETPGAIEWLRARNSGSGSTASARNSKAKKKNQKKKGKRRR